MSDEVIELSRALSSRYGLEALHCGAWEELTLWGGVGMDPPTFNALAAAAIEQGDSRATVYEMESTNVEFPPAAFNLDFESFNQLKANVACLFEVAMVPPSRKWVALLTDEPETFVYGPPAFLAAISRNLALTPNG